MVALKKINQIKRRVPDEFTIGYRPITREWVPERIDLFGEISFARI
jgi:hypothetical protein